MNRTTAALHDRGRILHLLLTQGPISKARLSKATQFGLAKISRIINEMISLELLRESGVPCAPDPPGRKDVLLELSPRSAWAAGVDIHGSGAKLCLVNASGQIIARETLPPRQDIEGFPGELGSAIEACAKRLNLDKEKYTGLGVSVPGIVNPQMGTVSKPDWKWKDFSLGDLMEKSLGSKVHIERDVICGAYGERQVGRARNCDNFIYFLIRPKWEKTGERKCESYDYGVGIVVDGRIHRGFNHGAGELAGALTLKPMTMEVSLDPHGPEEESRMMELLTSLARVTASLINLLDPEMAILSAEHRLLIPERLEIVEEMARRDILKKDKRRFRLINSIISMDGLSFGAAILSLHRGLRKRLKAPD